MDLPNWDYRSIKSNIILLEIVGKIVKIIFLVTHSCLGSDFSHANVILMNRLSEPCTFGARIFR